MENAVYRFLREKDRVRFLGAGVEAASESAGLARSQYEFGEVDFQRLLDSERALVLLQDQRTAARGQVAANLVAVYRALGGGRGRESFSDKPLSMWLNVG
ncbi:MAG: TolC family protein, partial [Planctomycetaceae bacterium]